MEQSQGGFRIDSAPAGGNALTLQGDIFINRFGIAGRPDAESDGRNLLGRWTHEFARDSSLQLQTYYERNVRDVPLQFRERRDTWDLDLQHHFKLGERQAVTLGLGYRRSEDGTGSVGRTFIFSPTGRTLTRPSAFVQDQIAIIPDRLILTLGSRWERNIYSGTEVQPSARLAFMPRTHTILWGGLSRAVRAPTRSDTDTRFLPIPANGFVVIAGDPLFRPEQAICYELGYRMKPHAQWFFDVAAFYNAFSRLRTLERTPPTGFPWVVKNQRYGETHGAEVGVTFQATSRWQLKGSYSFLREKPHFRAGSNDATGGTIEANDPPHLARLHSSLRLTGQFDLDASLRYSARLPNPKLPAYVALDLRFAWHPAERWELALVGQNLLDRHHPEFSGGSNQPELQRGGYVQASWRY